MIDGGTPWNTQRDVRLKRRVEASGKHRYLPDPRTGRETVDLQLRSRRAPGCNGDQMMDEFAQHTISKLCRDVNRSMEGVMNQLKNYTGSWDPATDKATLKRTSSLKQALADESEHEDVRTVQDCLFNVDRILQSVDDAANQIKLQKKARENQAEKVKDALLDAKLKALEKKKQGVIMWTPSPNRRQQQLISEIDKLRRYTSANHKTILRRMQREKCSIPPGEQDFMKMNRSSKFLADQDPLIRAAKSAQQMCRNQVRAHQKHTKLENERLLKVEEMDRLQQARIEAADKRHAASLEDIQKRKIRGAQSLWGPLCMLGPMAKLMLSKMLRARKWRDRRNKEVQSAMVIQRFVNLKIIIPERARKIRNGMKKLKWVLQSYLNRWRTKREAKATKIVVAFLKEELESNAPKRAVKMFMYKIRTVQNKWKEFRQWQKAVCAVRLDQYIVAEQEDIKAWHRKREEVIKQIKRGKRVKFDVERVPNPVGQQYRDLAVMNSFKESRRSLLESQEIFMEEWRLYWAELRKWHAMKKATLMFAESKAAKKAVEEDHDLGEVRDEPERPELAVKLDKDHLKLVLKEARKLSADAGKPHNPAPIKVKKKRR